MSALPDGFRPHFLPPAVLTRIQEATWVTRHKGHLCIKSPFDFALYMQLLDRLRPATIFEIGANQGGSALWFADMMQVYGQPGHVVSLDLPEVIAAMPFSDPRISFLAGDACNLAATLTPALLATLPRPWLVVEDSGHIFATSTGVLEFFDPLMASGEYIVVEDASLSYFVKPMYRVFEDGPLRAIAAFLARRGADYEVDRSLNDFYGPNVTWHCEGWLRRK